MAVNFAAMYQYAHDDVMPDKGSELSKKKQVADMFNRIAFRYDFMNRFLSFGIDVYWRKKAINELRPLKPQQILDVATGTGDLAIATYKLLKPQKITGIDISEGMLALGRKKIEEKKLTDVIELQSGDSETIDFGNDMFDAVTVAFGVRNFEHLEQGLAEILRVLKPGGKLMVLEFSQPKGFFKKMCDIYMNNITPFFGKLIARDKSAYEYLNKSVQAFPERENFISILQKLGYRKTYFKPLTAGICCIYCGSK